MMDTALVAPNIYPWHQNLWQKWQSLLEQQRLHHAILLCAQQGSGRTELVRYLAQTIMCQKSTTRHCHACHSCQLFAAGTHPDFHLIQPETKGKQLGIDAIRACVHFAWETSQLGGKRVILIKNIDAMTEAAANALLKTLEEPPSNCYFLLLSSSIDRLLPTLVSRCNIWKPELPDETKVQQWLADELGKAISLQVVRLNRGAPLAAKRFVESEMHLAHQELIEKLAQFINSKQGLFALNEKIIKVDDYQALQWLSFLLLDLMKIQQGVMNDLVHCDQLNILVNIAEQLPMMLVINQLQALNKLKLQLEKYSGLNTELMVSQWLSQFISPSNKKAVI